MAMVDMGVGGTTTTAATASTAKRRLYGFSFGGRRRAGAGGQDGRGRTKDYERRVVRQALAWVGEGSFGWLRRDVSG